LFNVVAVLTVVSCKKSDAAAEETVAADTTVVAVDSVAGLILWLEGLTLLLSTCC
jgi:hypothetical protein